MEFSDDLETESHGTAACPPLEAYRLWLAGVRPGLSNRKKRILSGAFQGAKGLYEAGETAWKSSGLVTEKEQTALSQHRREWDPEKERTSFATSDLSLVTLEEEAYPARLAHIDDAPYALFIKGDASVLASQDRIWAAIVGSRTCTGYGRQMAEVLGRVLAQNGAVVVSGMARGIDQAAHRGCLSAHGDTVAVLGSGADVCYPAESHALYRQITENGCVISEQLPRTPPLRENFPSRNRIISGLCDLVIVVEARHRSGSLITADFALEQGRDVYAVPGRVGDPMSDGTNLLIRQGAHILCSPEDLLITLGQLSDLRTEDLPGNARLLPSMTDETKSVYDSLDDYPQNLDDLGQQSGLTLLELLSGLAELTELGLARECFKNHYIRLR